MKRRHVMGDKIIRKVSRWRKCG